MKFTVESIEDNIARLEDASGTAVSVNYALLPSGVKEGDILLFDGENYTPDASATAQRRSAVYEKFNKLFRRE